MAEVPSAHSMLTAYGALAVRCWEDPAARQRFAGAPREALEAYGWEVPDRARVSIEFVELEPGAPRLGPDQIVTVWRRQMDAGELRIKIAAEPPGGEPGDRLAPTTYPP